MKAKSKTRSGQCMHVGVGNGVGFWGASFLHCLFIVSYVGVCTLGVILAALIGVWAWSMNYVAGHSSLMFCTRCCGYDG